MEKGWFLEELAGYEELVNPIGAQKILASARKLNSAVLKPDVAPTKRPIRGPRLQGETASQYLAARYTDPAALRLSVGNLFDNIVWAVTGTSAKSEEQIRLLGLHLGFDSTRPENEYGDGGPDNLWGIGPSINAVIELKTEVQRDDKRIIKDEAQQLVHSREWDEEHNPHVTKRLLVMIHPGSVRHPRAVMPRDSRVITRDDLEGLRTSVQRFADELAADHSWSDPKAVANALVANKLTAEQVIHAHSRKPTK